MPATCARANRGFFREIGIVDQTESSTLSDPVRPVTRRVPDISTLKTYPRAIASDGDLSSLLASYGFRDLSLKIHPRRAAPRRAATPPVLDSISARASGSCRGISSDDLSYPART